jgi:hypothetical protein
LPVVARGSLRIALLLRILLHDHVRDLRSKLQITPNNTRIAGTGVFPHVLTNNSTRCARGRAGAFWIHIKKGRADTKEPLIALLHVIYKTPKVEMVMIIKRRAALVVKKVSVCVVTFVN